MSEKPVCGKVWVLCNVHCIYTCICILCSMYTSVCTVCNVYVRMYMCIVVDLWT